MPLPELFANVPNVGQQGPQQLATLTQNITTAPPAGTVEKWTVSNAASSALTQGGGQFRVIINNEIMIVDAVSAKSTTWKFTRGAEGSVVQTHSTSSSILHFVSAGALQAMMQKPIGLYTPEQFGAAGDGVLMQYATMAAGSNLLNVADQSHPNASFFTGFTSDDVGKAVLVSSVGPNFESVAGTIVAVNSATQVQLSFSATNASPDVNGLGVAVYGTDDTAAIQAASDAAAATNFGITQFNSKCYVCAGPMVRGGSRFSNSQITLPYGGYYAGIGRLTWRGNLGSAGTPTMPFPSPAGAMLVSFATGQDYHTYMQPPTGVVATVNAVNTGTFAAGTVYYVITASTAKGETIGSAEVSATVAANNTVTLTWNVVSGASYYQIYRSTTSGGQTTSPAKVATNLVASTTSWTDTGAAATAGAAPSVNTASFGIPSFIGGPTQELSSSFSGWVHTFEDLMILCPRNPSVSGMNMERVSAQNRRRMTIGTLEFGFPGTGFIANPQCLPNKPWAAAMIDPISGNQQGAAGANDDITCWGFFVGHTPAEHTKSNNMMFHVTKIPLGIRQFFAHMARYDYITSEGNPYFLSGWDPTAVVIPSPPTPVPTQAGTGGTVAAGTYGVIVSYVNAAGGEVASVAGTVTTTGATSTITIPSPPAAATATGWYAYVTQAGGASYTRQQGAGAPTAIGTNLTLTAPPTNTGAAAPVYNSTGEKAAIVNVPTAGDPQRNGVFIEQVDFEDYSDTGTGTWPWATIVNHVNDANNQVRGRMNSSRWSYIGGTFRNVAGIIKTGGQAFWTRPASQVPDSVVLGRAVLDANSNTTGLALATANVWTPLNASNLVVTFVAPANGWVTFEAETCLAGSGATPYSCYIGLVDTGNNYIAGSGGILFGGSTSGASQRWHFRKYLYSLTPGTTYTWRLAIMNGGSGTISHFYGGNSLSGNAAAPYGITNFEIRALGDDQFGN